MGTWSWDVSERKQKRKRQAGYTNQVWLSERGFVAVMALLLLGGLVTTAIFSFFASFVDYLEVGLWTYLLAVFALGLVVPILGILISYRSDKWFVSLIGYSLVVVPMGFLLGPIFVLYELTSILNVAFATMCISAAMFLIGLVYPPIVKDYSGAIISVLLVLIVVNISYAVLPPENSKIVLGFIDIYRVFDFLAAGIFTGLIFYDVNRAMQLDHTLDNAVDSVIGIYLDVLNLFLYLLRLFGTKKSR